MRLLFVDDGRPGSGIPNRIEVGLSDRSHQMLPIARDGLLGALAEDGAENGAACDAVLFCVDEDTFEEAAGILGVCVRRRIPAIAIAEDRDRLHRRLIDLGARDVVAPADIEAAITASAEYARASDAALAAVNGSAAALVEALFNGHDGTLLLTPEGNDFRCRFASPACSALLGTPARDLAGRMIADGLPQETAEPLRRITAQVARDGRPFDGDIDLSAKSGQGRVAATARRVGDDVVLVLFDQTIDPETVDKLDEAEAELANTRQANREILSTLSYEMRTPLNTIIGFADMMVSEFLGPLPNSQYRDYVGDISRSGQMLLETVERLLSTGHFDALTKSGTEYRHIIELAPDLICILRQGRIVMINPAGAGMLGANSPRQLEDRIFADFVHEDYRELLDDGLDSLVAEQLRVPMKLTRLDGREVDVELAARNFHEEDAAEPGIMVVARDYSERNRAQAAAAAGEERLRRIMDTVVDGIVVVSDDGSVESLNPAAEAIFGTTAAEAIGRPLSRLFLTEDKPADFIKRLLRRPGERRGSHEAQAIRMGDGTVPVEVGVSETMFGKRHTFIAVVRDITERKRDEERLRFLATRDPLTGLPNRSLFQERLEEAIRRADRSKTKVAVLFVDLDHFKVVNDTLGHPVGDRLLQAAADRLLHAVRDGDTVARASGDEFIVILEKLERDEQVPEMAQKILKSLSEPFEIEGKQIYTSGSIGVTIYPEDAGDMAELMKKVDTAAYHAKAVGRNNVQFFTEQLSAKALNRLHIENGLRRALEKDEFHIVYQPKVDMDSRALIGAEALLRWENEDLGNVSPVEFIPVAEETGLIVPIGEWVIDTVGRQMAQWRSEGLVPVTMAINLSARQFRSLGLIDRIRELIAATGAPPELIEFELTESILVEDADQVATILKGLKKLGVSISVDDFGTGYSSLSYLKRFPLDGLKVDRSFIRDIPGDQDDVAITRAIISMAKSLGLKTIAEGVETESQVAFLNALDCDIGQGYLFGRPEVISDFVKRLSRA